MSIGEILLFTINSIMPVIIMIVLGYWLKTKGIINKSFLSIGNKMVFKVLLPVMLFKNTSEIGSITNVNWAAVIYANFIIALLIVFGWALTYCIEEPREKGVLHQAIFRSNFALIGVPVAELLGGSAGVKVVAILTLFTIPIFNIMAVIVLSVYKGKGTKLDTRKMIMDIVKNPLIWGVLLGLFVTLFNTFCPDSAVAATLGSLTFIKTTISYISRAATPIALIILGGQFDFSRVAGYKRQLIIGVSGRLLIAPILGILGAMILEGMGLVDFGPEVYAAYIALFGTPSAVSSAIMAEAMDNDGQYAAQLVVWTSLFSMATLFLLIFFAKWLGLL